ncbi:hypothetical protein Misp01_28870 [Microtetraspora sp. NBRC 13810]|nr:hypothetical protein Misp01_28870 [Microtetraspora sp. NBRC 13810]
MGSTSPAPGSKENAACGPSEPPSELDPPGERPDGRAGSGARHEGDQRGPVREGRRDENLTLSTRRPVTGAEKPIDAVPGTPPWRRTTRRGG